MNKYLFAAGVLSACAVFLLAVAPANAAESGKASWYKMGTHTANGERFKPEGLTAAHRTSAVRHQGTRQEPAQRQVGCRAHQ